MGKSQKLSGLFLAGLVIVPGAYLFNLKVMAGDSFDVEQYLPDLQIVQQTTLLPLTSPPAPTLLQIAKVPKKGIKVIVTAYSSSVWETDDTPLITASGKGVGEGIVANNLLPFGAKIRLPEIYGDRIFVVEDRVHSRKGNYHVDIWFPTTQDALNFGVKFATMEVLAN